MTRLLTNDETDREAPPAPTPLFDPQSITRAREIAARMQQEAASREPETEPTAEERKQQQADLVTGVLARMGFPVENWAPEWTGLPEEWRGRTSAYIDDLEQYVQAGQGMLVSAYTGAGKTSLLALIARAAMKHSIPCAYVLNGRTLLYQCRMIDRKQEARAGDYGAAGEDASLWKHWPHERTDLLLLDDVDYIPGVGFDPERNGWDMIGAFLYERMAAGLATCLCTNLPFRTMPGTDGAEVVGLLDKPSMDRVRDRAERYLPDSLRLVTKRGSQRAA